MIFTFTFTRSSNGSRIIRPNELATIGNFSYFEQLFSFRATFCILSNFQFSINSDISEQLLVLKLALIPNFTMFQQTIYEFPVKRSQILPPLSPTMGTRCMQTGLLGKRFFKENLKWQKKMVRSLDNSKTISLESYRNQTYHAIFLLF